MNNFAISSGGIGEALKRSASSLMAANNTLDESVALITGANTVVQDPTQVGTSFKTISMRIRGAKTELEEAGLETDGMVESTAKLRQEILALSGIDIMENSNEFKSTYKILDELATKWQDLTDIQQASITELIAGKRQGNIISSLMTNFDTVRDALETSLNSSGSAMIEHEKWSQSLEAQLLKLKASWQGLSQAFLNSDFLKVVLDGVINLVDGVTKLIDTFGTFPTLMSTIATGLSIFKNTGFLSVLNKDIAGAQKQLGLLGKSLTDIGRDMANGQGIFTSLFSGKSITKADVGHIEDFMKQIKSGVPTGKAWANTMANATVAGKKMAVSVKQGTVALSSLKTASIGGKVALLGMEVAAMAANAALTMGLSVAIQLVVEGIMKLVNAKKELAEKVEEITSKFKEQHKELTKNKPSFESDVDTYAKLSKGVDNLGRNVSLTADEYSNYQDVVNRIADQIPSLVSGYDSQGNAILNVEGNVDKLTAAYERLIKVQNNKVLKNEDDIVKDFDNSFRDVSNGGFPDDGKLSYETAKALEEFLSKGYSEEEISKYIEENLSTPQGRGEFSSQGAKNRILSALKANGVDTSGKTASQALSEVLKKDPDKIKEMLNGFEDEIDVTAEEIRTIFQAKLSNAFDLSDSKYANMNESLKNVAEQVVNNLDAKQIHEITKSQSLSDYVDNLLVNLEKIETSGNAKTIETAFSLETKFNNGEISYGDYISRIKEASEFIDGTDLDEEIKSQLKLDLNVDEVTEQYEALSNRLFKMVTDDSGHFTGANHVMQDVREFLNGLSAGEYAVAVDWIAKGKIDTSDLNLESFRKAIEKEAKLQEALNFETSIAVDKTSLEALNTALTESASAMGLTEESIDSLVSKYSDLDGYNFDTLFEKTANGIKVNREELAKLEKEYQESTKSEVEQHLKTLTEEYNNVTAEIDKYTNASERAELLSKREGYKTQIEELAEYQAQLEGVTGAYQRWIDAQNTPEDYEGYQAIATSKEDIKDEISRGFLSNATKEYIDLLSGKDLQGGTIDDYANAWSELDDKVTGAGHSIMDFFTVNEDGDITAQGIDRFFKSLQTDFKGSVAKFNEETKKWEYDFGAENLEKIQKKWGIGIESIELLLEAAKSAGYKIDWDSILSNVDLDTSSFETLVEYAESAQSELNKLKGYENLKFNFTTTNVTDATTEFEKARKAYVDLITNDDGNVNIETKGAEQMRVILSTLLVQKQQLSTPAIMKVDTSQIDQAKTDVIEVINKAKELQTAYENYEIAISTGVDVESAKKDLNSAIEGMKGTSVDVRAKLKLPTDDELKTAKDSVGDIEVGATLDDTAIGNMATKIQTECTPKIIAKVTGIDESAITDGEGGRQIKYTPEHSEVDAYVNGLKDIKKKIIFTYKTEGTKPKPKNIERTITYKYETEGTGPASGTAHTNGTTGRAFARGNWGIKGSGTALGGELGRRHCDHT